MRRARELMVHDSLGGGTVNGGRTLGIMRVYSATITVLALELLSVFGGLSMPATISGCDWERRSSAFSERP
jgi:hypothetical protein